MGESGRGKVWEPLEISSGARGQKPLQTVPPWKSRGVKTGVPRPGKRSPKLEGERCENVVRPRFINHGRESPIIRLNRSEERRGLQGVKREPVGTCLSRKEGSYQRRTATNAGAGRQGDLKKKALVAKRQEKGGHSFLLNGYGKGLY